MALDPFMGDGGVLKVAHLKKSLHVWRHLSA